MRLWNRVENGRPVLDEYQPRADDEELKVGLLRYLRSGTPVVVGRGRLPDPLSDDERRVIPLAYYTDGEWVWSGEDIYYLEHYDILPVDEEFLEGVRGRVEAPSLDEETMRRAIQFIQGGDGGSDT